MARPAIMVGLTLVMMETLNDIGAVEYLGVQTLTFSVYDNMAQSRQPRRCRTDRLRHAGVHIRADVRGAAGAQTATLLGPEDHGHGA